VSLLQSSVSHDPSEITQDLMIKKQLKTVVRLHISEENVIHFSGFYENSAFM